MYNMTNMTAATDILEINIAINQASGGIWGLFLMILPSIILIFVYLKEDYGLKKVMLADSIITTILSILLWTAGLITDALLIYPIIMIFATIIIYSFSD